MMMRWVGSFGLAVTVLLMSSATLAHASGRSERVLVGVYDATSAGGVALGGAAIRAALAGRADVAVKQLQELSADSLRGVDVLVLPAVSKWGGGVDSESVRQTLVLYVEAGAGLLLAYENVGLRGVFTSTLFPSIAKGVRSSSERRVRPVPGYTITRGLVEFQIGYDEQITLRRGPDGVVILRNGERENVGIMGDVGEGKVVMLGWPLGVGRTGKDRSLSDAETKLLENIVCWLASDERIPPATEYIECRVVKPLPERPSQAIRVTAPKGRRLRAGVAKVDITPKVGTKLAGFSGIRERHGTRVSTGVHTRLYVKALVLDNGDEKIALVSWDAITGPSRAHVAEIRRRIERKTGIPQRCVLINASHTHSGCMDDWVDETVDAVCRAYKNMKEARIGVRSKMVYGLATATHRIRWDGKVESFWGANQLNPDGLVDHECGVIRVEDSRRNLVAIWVNYACVGSVIGARHSVLSGDWMGVAMAELERRYPGAVALFAQGFAGDSRSHGFRKARTPAEADRLGKRFAEQVVRIVEHIDVRTWVPLAAETRRIQLPGKGRSFERELQAIVIGDCVLLATGWEIFAEIGLDIKERSLFDYTFCLELSNDRQIEYLAPKRAYLYEAETGIDYPDVYEPFTAQTSEALIRESLRLIEHMYQVVKAPGRPCEKN